MLKFLTKFRHSKFRAFIIFTSPPPGMQVHPQRQGHTASGTVRPRRPDSVVSTGAARGVRVQAVVDTVPWNSKRMLNEVRLQ